MEPVIFFYYLFSILFMIGYVNFEEIDNIGLFILAIVVLLAFAPLLFPIEIGRAIYKINN